MATDFLASIETTVPVARSVSQIQALVQRFGAAEFSVRYDPKTGEAVAVGFVVRDPHVSDGTLLPVSLAAPTDVIYAAILKGKRRGYDKTVQATARQQAARVAWRNLHDFVRASLIGVQTGIMSLGEAFMASLVVTLPNGETRRFGEAVAHGGILHPSAGNRLLLGPGSASEGRADG